MDNNKIVAPLAGGTTPIEKLAAIAAILKADTPATMELALDAITAIIDAPTGADANDAGIERRGGTHVEQLGPPSTAYVDEHPWCGWRIAFAADSDADTVSSFGMTERLMNINLLLTTADGRSRPVSIIESQIDMLDTTCSQCGKDANLCPCEAPTVDTDLCQRGIEVTELDTKHYEPMTPERRELVRYEDIREIVVF